LVLGLPGGLPEGRAPALLYRQPTRPSLARRRENAEHVLALGSWGVAAECTRAAVQLRSQLTKERAAGAHAAERAGKEAAAPWWGILVAAAARPPLFPRAGQAAHPEPARPSK
jgi:hypothetical protein